MQVGIAVIPYADSLDRTRQLVRIADEGGLPFVGVQDHPYQRHFFDTWSLIPTLFAETERISFFTDVAKPATVSTHQSAGPWFWPVGTVLGCAGVTWRGRRIPARRRSQASRERSVA